MSATTDECKSSSLRNENSIFLYDVPITVQKVSKAVTFLFHLFFQRKFIVHRLTGLAYLVQYAMALYLYFKNYELFKNSCLIWSLPLTGLLQSITAIFTFTFLPKNKLDSGYYTDRGLLSYAFILENSFFSGILLFPWLYYSDRFYSFISSSIIIDNIVVFIPYIPRMLWPKTQLRESLKNASKIKTKSSRIFYLFITTMTKVFYIWAKHYIGYFLNYIRFLNRATDEQIYHIYLLLIFSAFATTISIFLHTLKFKGYIAPKTSVMLYVISYLATFYSFIQIREVFIVNLDITFYVLIGLVLNFTRFQHPYQFCLMILFNLFKHNGLPANVIQYLFLTTR
ncbi:unnamed protein product [Didymodactylos carnosus]|uniref:Uncharacterized protein n=1 Tax=Didymodactylos carnosus TaxID=1234261 RepID=A0A814MZM6_9BILA|nr:unnamed protein product [Didymodactylos carnosus]CAF1085409.1 unnamed protein product [Didymodactylos carnosus]CAF3679444.1 unnamed protein product [Didymodactylos carnosus]CAF3851004.1 unnamed protein product [Didymodactylos carnosus]